MCNPDLTPYPLYHSGITGHDLSASPDVAKKCLNWDGFYEWMVDTRMVQKDEILDDE
jgi:hypothetical protein